jgi:hypothetical protein
MQKLIKIDAFAFSDFFPIVVLLLNFHQEEKLFRAVFWGYSSIVSIVFHSRIGS